MRHFLEQCLHSLSSALEGIEAEVWVVDNASSDESLPFLQPHFPRVKWIASTENLGFSRANNLALQRATGEFVLFLNPDTLLPEDCLHRCLAFMQGQKDAGALGIRMLDGSGGYLPESKRGYPGAFTSFFKLTGFAALLPHSRLFARYYLGHLSPAQNHPVEVLAGAFMLLRKQVLDITGGFDERFFMYGEDIDLSYTVNDTPVKGGSGNWRTWYFAESSIIHFKGESTQKESLHYVRTFYRAMLLFVKKHYSPLRAWVFGLLIYAAMALRALSGFIFRPRAVAPAAAPIWIAGTPEDFEEVKKLLAYPGMNHEVAGRLALANEVAAGITGLSEWYAKDDAHKGGTLVFCAGPSFPMKEILKYLDPRKNLRYMFHYKGSKSIVGSSHSNRSGEIIAPD